MVRQYLGCTPLDIYKTKYAMYSQQAWVLFWIEKYGQMKNIHHKAWLIDQIAQIMNGTQVVVSIAKWSDGKEEERFSLSDGSQQYFEWRKAQGEDYYYGIHPTHPY